MLSTYFVDSINNEMANRNLLSWIEISKKALSHNIKSLAVLSGKSKLAVSVKANAYGHGLLEISGLLINHHEIEYLTVHSFEEAQAARLGGWPRKIMILGPVQANMLEALFDYDIEPVIFEKTTLRNLGSISKRLKKNIRTHLKLETGTNRQGITEDELEDFVKIYKRYAYLKKPYGASTHFANIEDTTNHEYAEFQLKNFNRMINKLASLQMKPTVRHTASSAALILFKKTHFDLVRPGIAMYGHWPSKETIATHLMQGGKNNLFKPLLSWKTRITQLKSVAADEFVGYGCTYRTTKKTRLAVLPVGYYDGYSRALSNHSYVLVGGKRAPVRGRVCMNLMMADVSEIKGVKLGDEVTLIGRSGRDSVSAEQLAGWSNSINYEILSRLGSHIPRIIV